MNEIYIFNDTKIGVSKYFTYEVNISKHWKGGFCIIGNKFFKSNKLLNITCPRKVKKYKNYFIEKEITLIDAPIEFIKEMRLNLYIPKLKKKKK